MRFLSTLGLIGFIAQAIAQTPPGTTPATTKNLAVSYGNTKVTPGISLTQATVASIPTFNFVPTSSNQSFILFLIDWSINTTGLNTTALNATTQLPLAPGVAANRTTLLHFEQQGIKFASNGSLTNTTSPTAIYASPSPPAGDIAHTYVFYLYEQQAIFRQTTGNQFPNTTSRQSFNIANFAKTAGVGQLLAANYFTVQNNGTANATTGTASSTASKTSGTATASVTPFKGAAGTIGTGIEGTVAAVFAAGLGALML